jgi:hypothetical protein
MTRQRFIALLIAAFVAISGALYLSTQRNLARDPRGMSLLPSLANELNTVTSLSVRKGSAIPAVTVHKQGEQWTVAERADYPANVSKLRRLVLNLSDAKIREEKTSNPANYSMIGVEDPSHAGATGAEVEVVAQDGKHAVIVGKPAGEGNFVRRAGEEVSFLVEPGIPVEADPRYWIDTRLLDIPTDKIQSVEVKPAAAPGYTVRRVPKPDSKNADGGKVVDAVPRPPTNGDFTLDAVPATRRAADPQTLAPSPTAFSGLTAEDVAAAADVDFSKPSIIAVTTSDGNTVTITGTAVGDKRWIQIAAPADASLSAKTHGRAFEIASYRYDGIFRPLEQLLIPIRKSAPTPR